MKLVSSEFLLVRDRLLATEYFKRAGKWHREEHVLYFFCPNKCLAYKLPFQIVVLNSEKETYPPRQIEKSQVFKAGPPCFCRKWWVYSTLVVNEFLLLEWTELANILQSILVHRTTNRYTLCRFHVSILSLFPLTRLTHCFIDQNLSAGRLISFSILLWKLYKRSDKFILLKIPLCLIVELKTRCPAADGPYIETLMVTRMIRWYHLGSRVWTLDGRSMASNPHPIMKLTGKPVTFSLLDLTQKAVLLSLYIAWSFWKKKQNANVMNYLVVLVDIQEIKQ